MLLLDYPACCLRRVAGAAPGASCRRWPRGQACGQVQESVGQAGLEFGDPVEALAIPIDTFTGLSLDQQVKELFPAYLTFHRTWGPSLVDDLHIGGVLMWVAGDTLMLWPMIPVALEWMHLEERKRSASIASSMQPTKRKRPNWPDSWPTRAIRSTRRRRSSSPPRAARCQPSAG